MKTISSGARFKHALEEHSPLQIVGTINAYCAKLAKTAGHKAVYLSGGGVAAASHGLPDLGITSLNDVIDDAARICDATDLPLLVDIDTGWGGAFNIARTIRSMEKAGVAAVHIEDQVAQKRCGHRPNKAIVSQQEMADRIKAATDSRMDENFVVMARTDSLAVEGLEPAIERAIACVEAGADAIFPEAIIELNQYSRFAEAVNVPILANITEFGKTPLFNCSDLNDAGVAMVLYPLSAFRAMSKAALAVYETIAKDGDQSSLIEKMQSREELYEILNYHSYEKKLDSLFEESNKK
ncbi:MAG: methylisocitrate lyase [Gammaproteobacteria bacterium]|nr:methylisocitrate lyase [Gammaproteobacteria bacterium]